MLLTRARCEILVVEGCGDSPKVPTLFLAPSFREKEGESLSIVEHEEAHRNVTSAPYYDSPYRYIDDCN